MNRNKTPHHRTSHPEVPPATPNAAPVEETQLAKQADSPSALEVPLPLEPDPEVSPSYFELADAAIAALWKVAEFIPGYRVAPAGRRRQIANAAALPNDGMIVVAKGCEASDTLAATSMVTTEKVRDALAFDQAFTAVARASEVFTRGVEDTVVEKRAEVGTLCLRAIKIGRGLKLPDGRLTLVSHLKQMEDALKRRTKSRLDREVSAAVKDAKRSAPPLTVNVSTSTPSTTDATVQFKAGRDLET
jgi:hypothetical protein